MIGRHRNITQLATNRDIGELQRAASQRCTSPQHTGHSLDPRDEHDGRQRIEDAAQHGVPGERARGELPERDRAPGLLDVLLAARELRRLERDARPRAPAREAERAGQVEEARRHRGRLEAATRAGAQSLAAQDDIVLGGFEGGRGDVVVVALR